MKLIFICLTIFLSQIVLSQNLTINSGDIIEPSTEEEINLYKDLKDYLAQDGNWLPYRINVVHKTNENIFVWFSLKNRGGKLADRNALFIFDNKLNFKKCFSLDELMEAKRYEFKQALSFSNKILLYFTVQDKKLIDEYVGLFEVRLDPETMELSTANLILDISYSNLEHNYAFKISENKKYMAIFADVGVYKYKCSYSYLLYDENLNEVQKLITQTQEKENYQEYQGAFVSNAGDIILLFGRLRNGNPITSYLNLFTYDKSGSFNSALYEFSEDEILSLKVIDSDESSFLYVSLINQTEWNNSCVKLYSIGEPQPLINYTFENEWIEPFYHFWIDETESPSNKISGMYSIAPLELVKLHMYENTYNLVLVKNNPVSTSLINTSGYGVGQSTNTSTNNKYAQDFTDVRGDIVFLKFDSEGKFLLKQKIERENLLKTPNHEMLVFKDGKLLVVYSDLNHEVLNDLQRKPMTKKYWEILQENKELYATTVDLSSFNVSKPSTLVFNDSESEKKYQLWTKNILVDETSIYTMAAAHEMNERLIKISVEF